MSEDLTKGEVSELDVPTPISGTTNSAGNFEDGRDLEAQKEQDLAADGVILEETESEDLAEEGLPEIANPVVEQESYWAGFFSAPAKPVLDASSAPLVSTTVDPEVGTGEEV